MEFEGDSNATVIRHLFTVPRAHDDIPDCHVPSEHLIEMAAKSVGFGALLQCRGELHRSQLLDDEVHVVVEIATDDNRSIRVLFHDILHDIGDSLRAVLQVLLFSRLEIAVENLDVGVTQLQLGPAKVGTECLHQLQSGVSPRRIPAPTIALEHRLVRPEPTQEQG